MQAKARSERDPAAPATAASARASEVVVLERSLALAAQSKDAPLERGAFVQANPFMPLPRAPRLRILRCGLGTRMVRTCGSWALRANLSGRRHRACKL